MQLNNLPKDEISLKILSKLNGLGVQGVVVSEPVTGPIISSYSVTVSNRTPVNKIFQRQADIAIAIGVDNIDIKQIGFEIIIFVPNKDRKIVNFLDSLNWYLKDENVDKMQIPILIGIDAVGNNAALDLAEQPHMLVAGSTGSGKSTFISSVIGALSVKKSPEELKLMLVDTKRLDLTLFEKLPHVDKVVREIDEWYEIANNLYNEVQARNSILEANKARNILEYNSNLSFGQKMPHIVVIIDELADLIEKDKIKIQEDKLNEEYHAELKVIESIQRLIQIARASGIHFITCTQRTTVDVISGTVKANFPTRIALRLPQSNDSRAILGAAGAESLLGMGDMLIQQSNLDTISRFHGSYVRLEDVVQVVEQRERLLEIFK